ncbi:quinon protein alcohol dehydrogenase-like superfamily [Lipomyces chichibuensis]|uniref:quinon protein alcohol dehydrogenase-like superfamily n=1 Tax=Lipomyces chichibuensis TaxID=1546026 RepID=UPI003343B6FA
MVTSYLRYEPDASFGVISSNSNILWLPQSSSSASAGQVVVGALESVMVWDIKKGEKVHKWNEIDIKVEVSCIAKHDDDIFAVGYSDGSIRVWDAKTGSIIVSFNGHKTAISALKFDPSGTRLASGSRDSNIIVWDLISEVGLYRLRSHKDQITGLEFIASMGDDVETAVDEDMITSNWLISTSKDGFIKLWDLASQHCIETHVAHRGECWALTFNNGVCMTAGGESEIKVWQLNVKNGGDGNRFSVQGVLLRQSKERAAGIAFHPSAPFVACYGSDRAVEVWRIRSAEEVKKSVSRKLRRRKEKLAAKGEEANEKDILEDITEDDVTEIYVPFVIVRTPARVRSMDWAFTTLDFQKKDTLQIVVSLSSNCVELYSITVPQQHKKISPPPEYNRLYALDIPGHRTDVRSLALSSDDKMLATASNGSLKVWNVKTTNCIRTFDCGYALCSTFLPGDSILVVGTKSGQIEMFDVASSALLDTIDAHDGALWSLQVSPDGKSLVTGSADKSVKFWNFRIVQEEIPGTRRTTPRMKLQHTRTLELTDDVLSLRQSPDGKYIAVSLLDNTIKVFFVDTLKFFLNLYGHKLPVLSMDISHDSKLLVSCSADKNIKIWGLDFGDCHRSIFAHQESIMAIRFEPNSHYFFSASKDRLIKYWDGDKFENIQKLEGHHSEIWAIAVANSGEFVVSASHDRSIRIWQQTDDPIFLEEEREKELEELYESTLIKSLDGLEGSGEKESDEITTAAAGKQTVETLVAGERIVEALDLGVADIELLEEHDLMKKKNPNAAPPSRNAVFVALDNIAAERYVLDVLEKIKASQLQDALLLLPFEKVLSLLRFINMWAEKGWNITLASRILFFLIRLYHRQIITNEIMRPMLSSVREHLRGAIQRQKDELGYNIAGLKYIRRAYHEGHTKEFLDDEEHKKEEERSLKKRILTTI